ncbi:hypothetical protein DL771_005556 [Monosporascus sp. 5C6A]|nr:hypothetical protein DL771_005556 [Monosporascus sp. 5C6A]
MDSFAGISPHLPLSPSDPTEIRIVRLYPGRFDDEVRCELEHFSLARGDASYIALSYTWGNPTVTAPIRLDNVPFPVTLNLESFLRHMQTMLLTIVEHLPEVLRSLRPECAVIRNIVAQRVLEDFNLPRNFPATNEPIITDLVRHHIHRMMIDQGYQAEVIDGLIHTPGDSVMARGDSTACYITLWIDAICINQRDQEERNEQVSRMKDIYSQSPSTIIWLGDTLPSNDNVDTAIDLIHDIYRAVQPHLEGEINWPAVLDQITSDDFAAPGLEILRQILTLSWFSRVWIIQEVATATGPIIALLGYRPIPWRFLTHVVFAACDDMCKLSDDYAVGLMFRGDAKNMSALRDMTKEYAAMIQLRREATGSIDVPERLYSLLRQTCGIFKTTDGHDVLYSLLGLLGSDIIPPELAPNYNSTISNVFHQYAIYLVNHTSKIDFLNIRRRALTGAPSWVPDWRYAGMDKLPLDQDQRMAGSPRITENGLCLELDGLPLGRVVTVVHPTAIAASLDRDDIARLSDEADDSEFDRRMRAIIQGLQNLKRMCVTNLKSNTGIALNDFPCDIWRRFWTANDESHRAVIEMVDENQEVETWIDDKSRTLLLLLSYEIRRISMTGLAILDGFQLVTTCREDDPILEGDIVVALRGFKQPCILRQDGHCFFFVGACGTNSFELSDSEAAFAAGSERFKLV